MATYHFFSVIFIPKNLEKIAKVRITVSLKYYPKNIFAEKHGRSFEVSLKMNFQHKFKKLTDIFMLFTVP